MYGILCQPVVLTIDFYSCGGAGLFTSETLICVRSLELISMVDSLIASAAFMECLMPEERLHGMMVKSMDSGPRLRGFKARLCSLPSG